MVQKYSLVLASWWRKESHWIVTFFIFSWSEIDANAVKETKFPFISLLNSEICEKIEWGHKTMKDNLHWKLNVNNIVLPHFTNTEMTKSLQGMNAIVVSNIENTYFYKDIYWDYITVFMGQCIIWSRAFNKICSRFMPL